MVTTLIVIFIIYLLAAGGENGWYNRKARDGFGRLNSKFNSKGRYSELGYGADNQYTQNDNPYGTYENQSNDNFGSTGFGSSNGFGSSDGFGSTGFGSSNGFGSNGGFGSADGFGKPKSRFNSSSSNGFNSEDRQDDFKNPFN